MVFPLRCVAHPALEQKVAFGRPFALITALEYMRVGSSLRNRWADFLRSSWRLPLDQPRRFWIHQQDGGFAQAT